MPEMLEADVIEGSLTFAVDTGEKIETYPERDVDDPTRNVGKYETRTVTLRDGRAMRDRFSLDREGFILVDDKTAVTDFYDDDEVRRIYYPECIELVKKLTGADEVMVFDHTIRVEDRDKRAAKDVRGPVPTVHNDFTDWSGKKRIRDLYPPEEAEARLQRHFTSINVWRPLHGPVKTAPLALCDATTMGPSDFIVAAHIYHNRRGETYRVAYSDGQQWYYFSDMRPDEAVLIKCYDSATDGRTRFNAHGAAELAGRPANVPPRESIEVRTFAFFND